MGYVDRSVLKQMCADVGEDMLETLISYFVEDATEKIASFKVKLENRDYKALGVDRKSTRLNSSHNVASRMPSSA